MMFLKINLHLLKRKTHRHGPSHSLTSAENSMGFVSDAEGNLANRLKINPPEQSGN